MSINKVMISGNLGKDAELKYTPAQMAVVQFSVAINHSVKKGNDYENKTIWINCVMFRARAEKLQPHLTKGTKVAIEGHLSVSTWQGNDGNLRSKTEVIVDDIEFLSAKNTQHQQQTQSQQASYQQQQPPQQQTSYQQQAQQQVAGGYYDEDIPF